MLSGIIRSMGLLIFLYLSWRNLRDNYKSEDLVAYGWLSVLVFLFSSRISYGLLNWGVFENFGDWFLVWQVPGANYLGGYLGWVAASAYWAGKKEWKFWPLAEDMSFNILWLLGLFMADELVRSGFGIEAMAVLASLATGALVSWLVRKRYRSFVWYRSGKKGFLFIFANILIFLLLGGVSGLVLGETIRMYLFFGLAGASLFQMLALGDVLAGVNIYAKKRR